MLCSTLEAYFQGRRDLFKGLAIDSPEMETEWKEYPVLRFNISSIKDMLVPVIGTYKLGIPNNEVRTGLMKNVLPMMTGTTSSDNTSYATNVVNCLNKYNIIK